MKRSQPTATVAEALRGFAMLSLFALQMTRGYGEGAPVEAPEKSPPRPEPGAWSQAVNGLECRVVQLPRPLDGRVQSLFSVQLRNSGEKELTLNSSAGYDLPLIFSVGNQHTVELKPNQEVRCDLRLPEGGSRLRLRPGEMAAFTRPVPSQFQQHGMGYYTVYQASGRRAWSLLPRQRRGQEPAGEMTVRFVYRQEAGPSAPVAEEEEEGAVWTGQVESPVVTVRQEGPVTRLSRAEHQALYGNQRGKILANLRCELSPLEERVTVGRPCRFRLFLRNHSQKPRQYKPVVGLLSPGGLRVTGPDGKSVPCRQEAPAAEAKLRSIGGQQRGVVTLCEFDLALAYDLSKLGKYQVQFPQTGGAEEAEVVLPPSNVAEVEIVTGMDEVLSPPEPDRGPFTVKGTINSGDGAGAAGAKLVLWPAGEVSYLTVIPLEPERATGAKTAAADAKGQFAIPDVGPGDYRLLATHPELGSSIAKITFAFRPEDSYEIALSRLSLRGTLRDKEGAKPVVGAQLTLQPAQYGMRKPTYVAPAVITDAQGEFAIPGLAGGDYTLTVKLSDDKQARFAKPISVRDSPLEIDVFMPSCSLSGKVITMDGGAVPNASVSLQPTSRGMHFGSKSTKTDEKGEFSLTEIADGPYVLRVQGPPRRAIAKGAPSHRAEMDLTFAREQPDRHLEVKLGGKPPRVLIRVSGIDGKPVCDQVFQGAARTARGSSAGGFRTDKDGVLSRPVRAGVETHFVLIAESLGAWGEVRVTPQAGTAETHAEVKLQPCGSASGKVVATESGRPVGGAFVGPNPVGLSDGYSRPYRMLSRHGPGAPNAVSQDGTGSFTLPALPPGEYEVSFRDPHRAVQEQKAPPVRFTVTAGQGTDGIEVPFTPPEGSVSLKGLLVDRNDKPVPNRDLVLRTGNRMGFGDPTIRRLHTDEEGRFELYPVKPDFHELLPFFPGERKPAGPPVRFEAKPGREGQEIRVPLNIAQEPTREAEMPAPSPPGTWGKPVDELRTRLTPAKPKFEQFDPVMVRIEIENIGKWPKHYDPQGLKRSFRGKAPDGKPLQHVAMPYQTAGGRGPMVGPGEKKLVGEVHLTDEFDLSRIGKYQVQYMGYGIPPSNVAELAIVPRAKSRPRPSIGLALPPGFVDAIRSALPEGWALAGTDGGWKREEPGYNCPRMVWIICTKTISTMEAARRGQEGLSYFLVLYDRRLEGPGLAPVKDLRLIGENDWYRVYAKGKPDPKHGWKDPDADIVKALKLKQPEE